MYDDDGFNNATIFPYIHAHTYTKSLSKNFELKNTDFAADIGSSMSWVQTNRAREENATCLIHISPLIGTINWYYITQLAFVHSYWRCIVHVCQPHTDCQLLIMKNLFNHKSTESFGNNRIMAIAIYRTLCNLHITFSPSAPCLDHFFLHMYTGIGCKVCRHTQIFTVCDAWYTCNTRFLTSLLR